MMTNNQQIDKPIISADSHITEAPHTYIDYIDKKYLDRAPKMVSHEKYGDLFIIDGLDTKIPMGLVAAAGVDPKDLRPGGAKWEDLHKGGWDAKFRIADQEEDGIGAEFLYPTVGMMLCNHPDYDYKKACFDAYNLWLQEYCSENPERLLGLGQTAVRNVDEAIDDIRKMKEMGFKGVMLPGMPQQEDYYHPMYDAMWEACVEMKMVPSFHILTNSGDKLIDQRGPKINGFLAIIRGCQDILGTLVYGGVFQRHPALKVVCVEADAGWVPHYMYRMDHAYKRHRYWMKCEEMEKLPSEYFREHIYLTFQDDYTAFEFRNSMNKKRLLWANDFPHSDSTWPWSQGMLTEQLATMTVEEKNMFLHDNVAELYGLSI